MHLTSSELRALNHARYEISALQVEVQLMRLQLIYKANFNPNQPRAARGQPDGGQWTRVGRRVGESATSQRVGADDDARPAEPMARAGTETTTLPDNHRIVRDRSGTEPWEVYVDTLRPNGSVAERTVINRDGTAIRSQYSTTPELTGWDESHTIIGAGGETLTCQNLGKTQTILDGSGELIQIASWRNSGPEIEYLRPDLGFGGPSVDDDLGLVGGAALLGLALGLYAWFASTATQEQKPVFALTAREYQKPGDGTAVAPLFVGLLSDEEVAAACPGITDIQTWLNDATIKAGDRTSYKSAAAYGTAVHKEFADNVRAEEDENLKAEVSYSKSVEEGYGVPGTIRYDAIDNRPDKTAVGTVCLYDPKTGKKPLTPARSIEMVREVWSAFPGTERFIAIEMRAKF